MKAFIIKNKDGKYLRGAYGKNGEYCWTKDIINAMTYGFNDFVPHPIENCMLVPITIAEGDLEQENKQLEEQLAEKEKENKLLRDVLDNLKGDKASQKLVDAVNAVYEPLLEQRDALIRKQVCEEIMRIVNVTDMQTFGSRGLEVNKYIKNIIDQIEQGEQQ